MLVSGKLMHMYVMTQSSKYSRLILADGTGNNCPCKGTNGKTKALTTLQPKGIY